MKILDLLNVLVFPDEYEYTIIIDSGNIVTCNLNSIYKVAIRNNFKVKKINFDNYVETHIVNNNDCVLDCILESKCTAHKYIQIVSEGVATEELTKAKQDDSLTFA